MRDDLRDEGPVIAFQVRLATAIWSQDKSLVAAQQHQFAMQDSRVSVLSLAYGSEDLAPLLGALRPVPLDWNRVMHWPFLAQAGSRPSPTALPLYTCAAACPLDIALAQNDAALMQFLLDVDEVDILGPFRERAVSHIRFLLQHPTRFRKPPVGQPSPLRAALEAKPSALPLGQCAVVQLWLTHPHPVSPDVLEWLVATRPGPRELPVVRALLERIPPSSLRCPAAIRVPDWGTVPVLVAPFLLGDLTIASALVHCIRAKDGCDQHVAECLWLASAHGCRWWTAWSQAGPYRTL